MHKAGYLFVLTLLATASAQAQILNDSVKNLYGPSTVSVRRGFSVLSLLQPRERVDTSIYNLHHFDEWYLEPRNQKTMGYVASPAAAFFIDASRCQPGVTLGRDGLDYLFLNPDSLPNFQTYSLFTRVRYNQGSYGRQWAEVNASKNFGSALNVSGFYRRLTSQRQINVTRFKQKSVFHDAFAFNGNGAALKGRLRYAATYSFLNHSNYETGGILPENGDGVDSLFDFDLEAARFDNNAFNRERRRNFIAKAALGFDSARTFQILAAHRWYRQENKWYQPVVADNQLYDNYFLSTDSAVDNHRFQYRDYSIGFEGALFRKVRLSSEAFYRTFYYSTGPFTVHSIKNELHLLGNFGMQNVAFIRNLSGYVHLVAPSAFTLGAVAELPFARSEFNTGSTRPTLYQNRFISNNFIWENDFRNQKFLSFKQSVTLRVRKLTVAPFVQFQVIDDYIYYDSDRAPKQAPQPIRVGYFGLSTRLDTRIFQTDLFVQKSTFAGPDVLRQPELFTRLQAFFKLNFAQGKYQMQPGLETRWRTGFVADKYEPVTGQFYLQDKNASGDGAVMKGYMPANTYFLTTVFVNVKINRTRVFLKFGNVLQGLGGGGYFDVPYYPGQRRYFEFGIDWMFFN